AAQNGLVRNGSFTRCPDHDSANWSRALRIAFPVDQLTASTLRAEIGAHLDQFPTPHSLAGWAGLCPGNKESAGKRLSGKTAQGNVWLRRTLCQAAGAASRTKEHLSRSSVPTPNGAQR